MNLKEVLQQTPGLNRRLIYYLESKGYIRPEKVPKARISRRNYTKEDLKTIQEVWRYYQRGYSLQAAYDLASTQERTVGYMTLHAPPIRWKEIVDGVKKLDHVTAVSAVYGTSLDIIVKTDTANESEIYSSLIPTLGEMGVWSVPQIFIAREQFHRDSGDEEEAKPGMMAYILMKVPGKDVERVMEALKALEGIKEASTIYGESDIIVKVEADNQAELDRLVMDKVHQIPAVESTRTFIVVSALHWER